MRTFTVPALVCLLSGFFSQELAAAPTPEALRDTIQHSVTGASETGRSTAAWQSEKQQLIQEIQELELKVAWTRFQLDKTRQWLASEQGHVETLNDNLARAETTRNSLTPLLEVLYGDLERHVHSDLPFLPEERSRRLAHIRTTLDSADATLSDKLGRLLEAMQVEADYGYSVDAHDELVQLADNTTAKATVFRLGRLSLFRLLEEGKRVERYDHQQKRWLAVPPQLAFEIEKGIDIANKKRVATLLSLPIGTLTEALDTRSTESSR